MVQPLVDAWHALLAIPHIGLYFTAGWVAYLFGLGGWILLQKREPVATLSWLLGLALLPYIGFIIYHYLGPQRIQRHRIRRARSRAQRLDPSGTEDAIARELARLMGGDVLLESEVGPTVFVVDLPGEAVPDGAAPFSRENAPRFPSASAATRRA